MADSFLDLSLEHAYRSSTHRLGRDFYGRLLDHASQYRRAVGYFSSSVFTVAPDEHVAYLQRGGRINLVCSDVFSPADLREVSAAIFDRPSVRRQWRLAEFPSSVLRETIISSRFLGWLIANDLLVIRIARLTAGGPTNLYHEKLGLFQDRHGNIVAFSGSANETEPGYVSNFERVDVFASFSTDPGERRRANAIEGHFRDLWNNNTAGVEVVPLHEALERRLLRPREASERDAADAENSPAPRLRTAPEALFPSPSVTLHRHQSEAIQAWAGAGGRGIMEMATGSGKTITALSLASRIYDEMQPGFVVLIVAPLIHLVDQWIDVSASFGLRPIRCAEGTGRWFDELSVAIQAVNSGHRPVLSIATTAATLTSDSFQRLLRTVRRPLLLIADEVHTYGAEAAHRALPHGDISRVGLSATPQRWMDPVGSARIERYFGPVVYRYALRDALRDEVLTPYRYFPQLLAFDPDETETYIDLTRQIVRFLGNDEDGAPNEIVKRLLIRRARLVGSARAKLPRLRSLLEFWTRETHILVYCGDGNVEGPDGDELVRQVEETVRIVGSDLGMICASYTAATPPKVRRTLLRDFASGDLQVLVAIRCLDEGVDVPATRTAFMLASSTNPRQFVQRRGRVLRRFPGKSRADIHDFFIVPDPEEFPRSSGEFKMMRGLVRGQLARSQEFTELAENGPVAAGLLRPLRDHFDLLTEG